MDHGVDGCTLASAVNSTLSHSLSPSTDVLFPQLMMPGHRRIRIPSSASRSLSHGSSFFGVLINLFGCFELSWTTGRGMELVESCPTHTRGLSWALPVVAELVVVVEVAVVQWWKQFLCV